MVFSSTIFLFLFLPFVLAVNFLLPRVLRNLFLLMASLFFYAWGEGAMVLVMLISVVLNYTAGIAVARFAHQASGRIILGVAIAVNLSLLIYYKYLNFIVGMIPFIKEYVSAHAGSVVLPLGISFYTFHSISYLIDIYRKGLHGERNPIDLGLYIAFFPQLVAGPIVRYSDISDQLHQRTVNLDLFYEGIIRFIRGLAKKIMIANTVGLIADRVFELNAQEIPTSIAWLGIVCYTLQIYYDFSGYSDMAIGLAKMFGFNFKENFNYPYIASSIQDFWRRWHISLSTWFRDYLYISLGGNRLGNKRTYVNLIIVFFITGLWHGASWNFVVWGLFHGLFLILERSRVINIENYAPWKRHSYTLIIVVVGWVFFRSNGMVYALFYLKSMVGFSTGANFSPLTPVNYYTILIFILGAVFAGPVRPWVTAKIRSIAVPERIILIGRCAAYLLLFIWCADDLAQSSYNPFIYFRF